MKVGEAMFIEDANPFDPGGGCTLDGMPVSCGYAAGRAASGAVVRAPMQTVIFGTYQGVFGPAFFQATADGYQGFVPANARYAGEGRLGLIGPPKILRGGTKGDTDFRRLNGVSDDDPEAQLARTVAFQRSEMSDDKRSIQEKRRREGSDKDPGLTDCTKNYLSKFYDRSLLDTITWEHGIPWYVPMDAAGFTLGVHIYFGEGQYDSQNGISNGEMELIGHEAAHVQQFRQNGEFSMAMKYLFESAKQGAKGFVEGLSSPVPGLGVAFATHDSYYGNKYEIEAEAMEKKIRADMIKNGNPCR